MNKVTIPPYKIIETNVNTSGQVIDYWHSFLETAPSHLKTKGAKSVIYILDTAKEWTAPDISKEGNQYAFDGTGQINDPGQHGHLVAGIAAALNNTDGVLGVAPEALVIPVKGLHVNTGLYEWIIKGLNYIKDHYKNNFKGKKIGIINMSFGGPSAYEPLRNAIQECVNEGLIPVAAAGNNGGAVNYPGAWDDLVITITALGPDKFPANFTSYGEESDATAFGVNVVSTAPNGTYPRVSGTSFSSPMVAGVVALIGDYHFDELKDLGANTKTTIEAHIKKYATDLLEPGEDDKTGAGLTVISPYLDNPIKKEDNPPPPPPPDDPDEKEERNIKFIIDDKFRIVWQATLEYSMMLTESSKISPNSPGYKILNIDKLILEVTTKKFAEEAYVDIRKAVNDFFQGRGLILNKDSDMNDAAKWTIYFLELILKKQGFNFKVLSGEFSDINKVKLIW